MIIKANADAIYQQTKVLIIGVCTGHDDVIKWKHFPRYWPFVREIHRSPVNFPHKGQWRGALMFTLICARLNGWVNNREAGDLRRQHGHYDVIVMESWTLGFKLTYLMYGDDMHCWKYGSWNPSTLMMGDIHEYQWTLWINMDC